MDGIGVAASMFRGGAPDMSKWRPGVEYARADTGNDFPDRYDAVIPIEEVTVLPEGGIRLGDAVRVARGSSSPPPGGQA